MSYLFYAVGLSLVQRKIGKNGGSDPEIMTFVQQRHKTQSSLDRSRELLIACAPLRSNVNLSHILRLAGCAGVERVVCCGHARVIDKIARDGADTVQLEVHRTLPPVLKQLKADGYQLVGLEQTNDSESLYEFRFARRTALIVGNERQGLTEEELACVDRIAEIPIYGLPFAYNVHTAVAMAVYEYCRQFPRG
jgi:tRNA G18 (ribose-2'-O)-methylase SpoU